MQHWEYCAVSVTMYSEGSGGEPLELLHIRLPGAHKTSISHPYGLVGLLNQLGTEGWELVDVEAATFYLKRQRKS